MGRFEDLKRHHIINGTHQIRIRMRNNMRNILMYSEYKILLCKMAVIETTNNELKNIAKISSGTVTSTA